MDCRRTILLLLAETWLAAANLWAATPPPVSKKTGLAVLREEADAMRPFVQSDLARRFLDSVDDLPSVKPRKLYHDRIKNQYYTAAEAERVPQTARSSWTVREVDESFYYTTKYGTPLAYARPLDLVGREYCRDVEGKRILDFGYGTVGHLRLLAAMGADVVGVDVDPLLPALYSEPSDQGTVRSRSGRQVRLKLVHGRFPADEPIRRAAGGNFDLILSKNTLKNGYLHPAQPVDKRLRIDLGVDDAAFVHGLNAALKPGGYVLIYNLCPAPSPPGKPYKPWADGRCPFPKRMWEEAGFTVLALDVDDSLAARRMGHLVSWDKGDDAMNLEKDLFALFTLVRKKVK
jgi:SAM-dependent methyltransferase